MQTSPMTYDLLLSRPPQPFPLFSKEVSFRTSIYGNVRSKPKIDLCNWLLYLTIDTLRLYSA